MRRGRVLVVMAERGSQSDPGDCGAGLGMERGDWGVRVWVCRGLVRERIRVLFDVFTVYL